jgi:hypothetical protein
LISSLILVEWAENLTYSLFLCARLASLASTGLECGMDFRRVRALG